MACSSNTCTTQLLSVVFKSSEKWKWWRWPVEWVEREKTATRLNLIITSPSLHHHFIIIRGHPGHPDSHHYLAVVTRGLHQTLPSLHHLLIITSPSHTRGHLGNPDNHTIIISSIQAIDININIMDHDTEMKRTRIWTWTGTIVKIYGNNTVKSNNL